MSTTNRPDDPNRARRSDDIDEESLATKVVLVELLDASRPLSVGDLRERTRLAEATVRSALVALAGVGICEKTDPGGDRPTRYRFAG